MAKAKGKASKGSWNAWLESFKIGERRYLETTLEKYRRLMSTTVNPSRKTAKMVEEGYVFSSSMFTAVGTGLGEIRYLLCVERKPNICHTANSVEKQAPEVPCDNQEDDAEHPYKIAMEEK